MSTTPRPALYSQSDDAKIATGLDLLTTFQMGPLERGLFEDELNDLAFDYPDIDGRVQRERLARELASSTQEGWDPAQQDEIRRMEQRFASAWHLPYASHRLRPTWVGLYDGLTLSIPRLAVLARNLPQIVADTPTALWLQRLFLRPQVWHPPLDENRPLLTALRSLTAQADLVPALSVFRCLDLGTYFPGLSLPWLNRTSLSATILSWCQSRSEKSLTSVLDLGGLVTGHDTATWLESLLIRFPLLTVAVPKMVPLMAVDPQYLTPERSGLEDRLRRLKNLFRATPRPGLPPGWDGRPYSRLHTSWAPSQPPAA